VDIVANVRNEYRRGRQGGHIGEHEILDRDEAILRQFDPGHPPLGSPGTDDLLVEETHNTRVVDSKRWVRRVGDRTQVVR